MRILHLTPELPYWPGGSGGSTRQFHLLRRLVELGHDVTVVAPATIEQTPRIADLEAAGLRAAVCRRPKSRWAETARALCAEPALIPRAIDSPVLAWQVSVFWTRLRAIALRASGEFRPDVVSVEHDHAAAWLRDLPGQPAAVLTLQNIGWRYYESRSNASSRPVGAALALEAKRFRRYDARHLGRYDGLIAMSESDAEAIRFAGPPVEIVPNGVATAELAPYPPSTDSMALLFTGTMAYPPNAQGIQWFVREVWPLIRAQEPDATLTVVGRNPPAGVRMLSDDPAIEVTGAVSDVGPYFERATAVVAPVLSGGGTRLKVLEAWSARRALVATSQAVEGIHLEAGRHALIEDRPDRFAAATLRLLREPELRESLASEGRALVEERYDWRSIGERFEQVLSDLRSGESRRS